MFSFGITILSAASKKDWTIFYDFIENKVEINKLFYEIEELEKRGFSKRLCMLLQNCLQQNPSQRLSVRDLIDMQRGKTKVPKSFW